MHTRVVKKIRFSKCYSAKVEICTIKYSTAALIKKKIYKKKCTMLRLNIYSAAHGIF